MSALLRDLVTSDARRNAHLASGAWDDVTLAGRVGDHATQAPDRVLVVDEAGEHRAGALANDAGALAAALASRGVGAGSVVSIQLPNRYETVVAAVAAQSLGAVINPLLPSYRQHELAHVFLTARPAAVFTPGVYRNVDHRDLAESVARATGVRPLHIVVGDRAGNGALEFDDFIASGAPGHLAAGAADAVSEVIFTSGTEARPKAVMHTEQTAGFSVRIAFDDLGLGDNDVVWMPSPVGHSTGFNYGLRLALHHGLTLVLQDRWDPDAAVDLVAAHGCTYTLAATTFLQDLVDAAARRSTTLDTLRCFGCGGAPVPPLLVDGALERGITVLRLYGSTEVLVATWNRPTSTLEQRQATDGIAMTDVEVQIRADDGSVAADGELGEIVVRGPNTCVGFYDDPERTAATFDADGWVRSGDLAVIRSDRHLTVVGRRKEIIIRGGLNIAPREIEELIGAFDEVERCAVVGLADARLGERMCACVVLRPGATLDLETTVDRLRQLGLAAFKLPEQLSVLDELPVTGSGKVQKHVLVDLLAGTPSGGT